MTDARREAWSTPFPGASGESLALLPSLRLTVTRIEREYLSVVEATVLQYFVILALTACYLYVETKSKVSTTGAVEILGVFFKNTNPSDAIGTISTNEVRISGGTTQWLSPYRHGGKCKMKCILHVGVC